MIELIQTIIGIPLAVFVAVKGSEYLGTRAAQNYDGMHDPQGNAGKAYVGATRAVCVLVAAVAGAIQTPSIIKTVVNAIEALG